MSEFYQDGVPLEEIKCPYCHEFQSFSPTHFGLRSMDGNDEGHWYRCDKCQESFRIREIVTRTYDVFI